MRIIDAHTHFFDPSRPQGVPWPNKNDTRLYRPTLPKDYQSRPVPQSVAGVVVVEASPWVEDNQWVLDLATNDPFIVGFVGNLPAGTPVFGAQLKRFAANPLFRGIRIKQGRLQAGLGQPAFLSDLRRLASHELELDVYGETTLLPAVAKLAEILPDLRVIINHMANPRIDAHVLDATWCDGIRAVAAHKHVYCKVSALVEGTSRDDGTAPAKPRLYSSVLDRVWEAFGEDRVIYGSNWPVCEQFGALAMVQGIVAEYFSRKGENAAKKFFSRNAVAAYKLG